MNVKRVRNVMKTWFPCTRRTSRKLRCKTKAMNQENRMLSKRGKGNLVHWRRNASSSSSHYIYVGMDHYQS
jgi:hypothetical protein